MNVINTKVGERYLISGFKCTVIETSPYFKALTDCGQQLSDVYPSTLTAEKI